MTSRYLKASILHVHIKIIISGTFYILPQLNTRNFKQTVNTGGGNFENDKQFAALWDIIVYKATMKGPTVLSNVS